MKQPGARQGPSASELISKRIADLGDWRGETLSRMRQLIKNADSSLDGNTRCAIDIHEGEAVDRSAFMALVRQAVALNRSGQSNRSKQTKS